MHTHTHTVDRWCMLQRRTTFEFSPFLSRWFAFYSVFMIIQEELILLNTFAFAFVYIQETWIDVNVYDCNHYYNCELSWMNKKMSVECSLSVKSNPKQTHKMNNGWAAAHNMNESWMDSSESFVMRTSVFRFTNISDNGISILGLSLSLLLSLYVCVRVLVVFFSLRLSMLCSCVSHFHFIQYISFSKLCLHTHTHTHSLPTIHILSNLNKCTLSVGAFIVHSLARSFVHIHTFVHIAKMLHIFFPFHWLPLYWHDRKHACVYLCARVCASLLRLTNKEPRSIGFFQLVKVG